MTSRGALAPGRVAVFLAILLLLTTALGWVVGSRATPDGRAFAWGTAATAATAAGTILLAAFTGTLAWTTSQDVSATWALAELQQREQTARNLPVVVMFALMHAPIVAPTPDGPADFTIRAVLRNVGLGPAIRIELSLTYTGEREVTPDRTVHYVLASLTPDEVGDAVFTWTTAGPLLESDLPLSSFRIGGRYLDRTMTVWHDLGDPTMAPP